MFIFSFFVFGYLGYFFSIFIGVLNFCFVLSFLCLFFYLVMVFYVLVVAGFNCSVVLVTGFFYFSFFWGRCGLFVVVIWYLFNLLGGFWFLYFVRPYFLV